MSLWKIPFLCVGALSTYTSLTPPQPKVAASERPKDITTFERVFSSIVRFYTAGSKLFICSGALLEISVILASKYSSHPVSQTILASLVPGPTSLTSQIGFSPLFFIGCGFATLGGFIRYQCYRTLGRFFTYEVTIQDDHRLVTEGPYAYVRHPSYTSSIACCSGMVTCYFSPGAWLWEYGILDTPWGKVAAWASIALFWTAVFALGSRTYVEDELLRKRFGKQWDEWAKKVPYRMIPYIF